MHALRSSANANDGGRAGRSPRVRRWAGWAGWVGLALVWLMCAFMQPVNAQERSAADKRIALVIGNARYPKFPLANPENDARLIAARLRTLGFEVGEHYNLNVLQFRRALRDF